VRYRCLILDHDDTVTDSTRTVHYPAYQAVMRELRPGEPVLSFDEWMSRNFHPGILDFLTGELRMDEEELSREYEIWRSFSSEADPPFFDGMLELLDSVRRAGGFIAVVSHSEADLIERNYRSASGGAFVPDIIYGWEMPEERRKPSPWPVLSILERLAVAAEDALVVDDLKPGVDMARAAGVRVAGAGWAYSIDRIRTFMKAYCDFYFESVAELRSHVLDE